MNIHCATGFTHIISFKAPSCEGGTTVTSVWTGKLEGRHVMSPSVLKSLDDDSLGVDQCLCPRPWVVTTRCPQGHLCPCVLVPYFLPWRGRTKRQFSFSLTQLSTELRCYLLIENLETPFCIPLGPGRVYIKALLFVRKRDTQPAFLRI